ncbi:FUSC family protein [Methylobacterium sp. ID0610]|uniref:FUSC family protein n=1 Tax=Methylobacterium carpenticola TaxID=3344827 RepID=UPI00369ABE49
MTKISTLAARPRAWLARNRAKVMQAGRMTVASLLTFALAGGLGLPQSFWAVITALIVTQSSLGSSLKAAVDRFLGSVLGAIYGGAVALTIPHQSGVASAFALVVAVAPLSVAAAHSAGFRIAPITAVIVLLSTTGSTLGPIAFAVDRILEVGLGCAVGLAVSHLVVPAHASRVVRNQAARTARLLAQQLDALGRHDDAAIDAQGLPLATRRSLDRLETLVAEAARERRSRLAAAPDAEPLARTLMRLRHDVVVLRRATREADLGPALETPWADASAAAARRLRGIADSLEAGQPPSRDEAALPAAIEAYRGAIDEMRRRQLTRALSTDVVGQIFWIAFSLDQMRRNLDDLAERAAETVAVMRDAA